MKTFIVGVVTFTIGSVSGFFVGKYISKKKYLDLADREVASIKKSYDEHYGLTKAKSSSEETISTTSVKKNDKTSLINQDSIKYETLKKDRVKYVEYASRYNTKTEEGEKDKEEPIHTYILTPEEFNNSEYDCKTLIWYADGVLADEEYNIVKDINGYIGAEALNSFGTYEDDCVYVRNDLYKIDYEVLLSEKEYSDEAPARLTNASPEDE